MDDDPIATGTIVAERYVVEALVGVGGLAEVYRVRHLELDTVHALKLLQSGGRRLDERLLREGQIQANLRHPNVVAVTDTLRVHGRIGLLMEYVDGPTLEQLLVDRGRLPVADALALIAPVLGAVAWAHEAGALHRDLKPNNILLVRTPVGFVPKVADFGIAKLTEAAEGSTRTGIAMGTPGYMPPEQVRNSAGTDRRADVFALGAILYEMIGGRKAFAEPDGGVTLTSTIDVAPPPLESLAEGVSTELSRAVARAIARDRDDRWDGVREFAEALAVEVPDGVSSLASAPSAFTAGTLRSRPPLSTPAAALTTDFDADEPPPALAVQPDERPPEVAAALVAPPPSGRARWTLALPLLVVASLVAGVLVVRSTWTGTTGTVAAGPPPSHQLPIPPPARAPESPSAPSAPAALEPSAPVEVQGVVAPSPPIVRSPSASRPDPVVPLVEAPPEAAPEREATEEPPAEEELALAVVSVTTVAPVSNEMDTLGYGEWRGLASNRTFSLKFTGVSDGALRAEAVFFAGQTRRVEFLAGSFSPADGTIALRAVDGAIAFEGRLVGDTLSGTYMQRAGRPLPWSVSR